MIEKKETKKEKKDVDLQAEETESVFDETHKEEDGKEEVAEGEEVSMPMSRVEKLLKDVEERLSSQFNSKLQKLKTASANIEIEDGKAYIADLEDDWLEAPVVFFAYSSNFSIHGDSKRGVYSEPPSGAIKFKTVIRTKRKGRKETQVISVSSVKVQSKAVVEWLRNHSQFGIAFFENMDSVMNVDTNWAQKLVEANQSIQRLSDQQVIARCRQEGLAIGTDPDRMRRELVEHVAKKSMKQQDRLLYGSLRNANIDKTTDRQVIEKG